MLAFATLALAGCGEGHARQSIDEMRQAAESRQVCHDEGGRFVQWTDGFNNEQWYCDFTDEETE